MTQPGIEPRSPGLLANSLTIMSMSGILLIQLYNNGQSIILLCASFSYQRQLMVLYWSLSDSMSPKLSRTLLCILNDLNNAVVWTLSARPPISKFSSPVTKRLGTVPSAPITISITVTFIFHSFLSRLAKYLSLFSFSLSCLPGR